MIDAMAAALAELGIVPAGLPLRFNAGIARGDTLWAHVYLDARTFVHVKLSELVSLREEAATHAAAARIFHDFMPRLLGYVVRDGWEVLVTEGLSYEAFAAGRFLASSSNTGVAGRVCELFEVARNAGGASVPAPNARALLDRLEQRFAGTPYPALLAHWRTSAGERELARLPVTPQHGDFVANNLAVRRSRLIVFDWEDYGKVSWPGFDLCTLVMTSLDPADVAAIGGRAGDDLRRRVPVLGAACRAIGITPEMFWRLVPLYLLRFLELKGTYGNEVRRRVERLLDVFVGPAMIAA